jgi:ketosteroid isomerase-like protein
VELWELVAREGIRETIARYAQYADSGRFDELVALFAPDGVLEVGNEPPLAGRDAIREYLGGVGAQLKTATTVPLIRHHTASVTIDVEGPDEARARCYFLAITEHGVDHWGRYRDDFVRDGEEWLFAHRRVRTDGRTPGGWAAGRSAD